MGILNFTAKAVAVGIRVLADKPFSTIVGVAGLTGITTAAVAWADISPLAYVCAGLLLGFCALAAGASSLHGEAKAETQELSEKITAANAPTWFGGPIIGNTISGSGRDGIHIENPGPH